MQKVSQEDEGRTTEGYPVRIQEAMAHAGVKAHALHVAVKERAPGMRGTSYSSIRLYADEEYRPDVPRLELLREIAEVLGVRYEWLAFNEGEMTAALEADRLRAEGMGEEALTEEEGVSPAALGPGASAHLREIVDDVVGARVPVVAHAVLFHWWWRLHRLAMSPELDHLDAARDREGALRQFAEAVAAPLEVMGIEDAGSLRRDALAEYVMAVAPAVAQAQELALREQIIRGIVAQNERRAAAEEA